MALGDGKLPKSRWISLQSAADIVGGRFYHCNWSRNDPAMLAFDPEAAPDREAWDRAKHIQDLLYDYITGGHITAYARTEDGTAITDLPLNWVTDPVFAISLHKGQFRLDFDIWEQLWIDGTKLREVLPKIAQPRQKHKFEWDKIVNEAWMFALQQHDLPTNAAIVRHLGDWCATRTLEIPDGSHLSKVAKPILDFLKGNKQGRQNLDMESCEAKDGMAE